MKMRRLSLIMLSVLMIAVVLVSPVLAGRATTPVTFQLQDPALAITWRDTGAATQSIWVFTGPVTSSDDRLTGDMTWTLRVTMVWPNAHNANVLPGTVWGPADCEWQIVTSAPGEMPSGWRGTAHTQPQVDPAKWDDVNIYRGTGNGFGLYRGMHIEWRLDPNTADPEHPTFVYVGEISENTE